jgi:pimeloyl-ACP methyl ester carboxylesterase
MQELEHRGCRLSFDIRGSGTPILFIQGVGVHGAGWEPQVSELSSRFSCLSFDNRGIGRSQPVGARPLTMEQMVDDALALAGSLGWSQFHVVGHSMGGHIATALALQVPTQVASLALLCTSGRGKDMPPITASFLWTSLRARVGSRPQRRRAFLEIVLPRRLRETEDLDNWAKRLEPIFGHDLADTPAVAMQQIRAYRKHNAELRLAELGRIPTLIVSATEDPLAPPRLGRALAQGIPGARFVEFENAAHGLTVSHVSEVNALLLEHLASAT